MISSYLRSISEKYLEDRKLGLTEYIAIFSILVGLFGLWYSGQEQISINKINDISKRQLQLSKALTDGISVVINQANLCPMTNIYQLKLMKNERVKAASKIRAYSSGITLSVDDKLKPLLTEITQEIYGIGNRQICTINTKSFDNKTNILMNQVDEVFRSSYKNEQNIVF